MNCDAEKYIVELENFQMSQDDGNVYVEPYISFRNIHDLLKGSPLIKMELKYRNEKVILSRHPRHG